MENLEKEIEQELDKEIEKELGGKPLKPPKGDICPHCTAYVGDFPYMMMDPIHMWVECTRCGVVFSPKSLRDQKLEKANARVIKPAGRLLVPA